jgi:hypothetical protein
MPLEMELEAFSRMKQQLLAAHAGKFALIHEAEFLGAFDTAENAYGEGVAKFGRGPFLVKRIQEQDERFRIYNGRTGSLTLAY